MRKRIAFSIMDTTLGYKTLKSCRLHVELLLRNPAMFFLLCERSIEYLMLGLISCNNIHLIRIATPMTVWFQLLFSSNTKTFPNFMGVLMFYDVYKKVGKHNDIHLLRIATRNATKQ